MKMISKIANVALGLVFIGSAVFGQSLNDAKKAIDAEQYQKAKGMLKNLTVTQPRSDENLFYLGWVYLVQDYPDSAKATFTKGIALDPKSALNYVGLGAVALAANDNAGATSQFNQAISVAGKKDDQPYLYIGKAYLMDAKDGKFPPAKANAAIDALTKAKTINPKDVDVQVTLGNAYRSQLNSNAAYDAYQAALAIDPKSVGATVATGVLWRYANNYDDSEKQFQAAIAIDPNYGPAYRELAETQKDEAQANLKVASVKIKEAVENYKKFITLTDESVESLLRYADFLVNAGDYATLQEVSAKLAKNANVNARVYRYLGYAAYENKDYKSALSALNNWFSKATPNRIYYLDYLYLGRTQVATGDTVKGVDNMKKAIDLDTSKANQIYGEITTLYKDAHKWPEMVQYYQEMIDKVHGKLLLTEHFYLGFAAYYDFRGQVTAAKTNPSIKPDSTLIARGDSAISYVQKNAPTQTYYYPMYRAYLNNLKDGDYANLKGLSKPYYEQLVTMLATKTPLSAGEKGALVDAYAYLGNFAEYHDKDDAKAMEYFTKARDLNPDNAYVKFYFDSKNQPAAGAKPAPKKTSK